MAIGTLAFGHVWSQTYGQVSGSLATGPLEGVDREIIQRMWERDGRP